MISSLLVVFCHCFQVKSSESQANPGSTHTKTGEEIHFPTKSAPGLYVNTSPAFSVSYPSQWLEKTPEHPFIFIAESSVGFPCLRVAVIPNMSAPLEYSAGFYFRALAKIGKGIKLLNDKKISLEDGSLAQETELEWVDKSETKLNGFFLTVKKKTPGS
jgi:hypothetical protein